MALFNRKKEDAPAPNTEQKPLTNEAFDFDAISRDLDAQGGASSFDSLLSQPAAPAQSATTKEADSAFDFPENDPLGLSSPPVAPPPRPHPAMTVPTTPETVINEPLVQPAMPSTGVAPVEVAPIEAPMGTTRLKNKKSLPLVPILGALGLLAVVGGGAMFFLNSNREAPEPEAPAPVVTRPRVAQNPAPVRPDQAAPQTAPGAGLRSASPGIAPPVVPTTPVQNTSRVVQNSATPARPVTPKLPSATAGLDPAMASRLKALWKVGADAKHRNDFTGARKAWQQALQLAPKHPGFQDSINQLPR